MIYLIVLLLAQAQAQTFDLDKILSKYDAAMIGWAHVTGNPVLELFLEELHARPDLVLLTEDSFGAPPYQQVFNPDMQKLFDTAHALKIRTEGADHPVVYQQFVANRAKFNDLNLPQAERLRALAELPKITAWERDQHMAGVVERFVRQGKKVIFLVGGNHLVGVARALKDREISFVARGTSVDPKTGAVYLENRFLGQIADSLNARFELKRLAVQLRGARIAEVPSLSWRPKKSKGPIGRALGRCAAILLARPYDEVATFKLSDLD